MATAKYPAPSQALLLNYLPDEKVAFLANVGSLPPEDLGIYIKELAARSSFHEITCTKILDQKILDIARYAASGGNGQPVQWRIVYDPEEVDRLASLTVDWMKTLKNSSHPMSGYIPSLIAAWEVGKLFRSAAGHRTL